MEIGNDARHIVSGAGDKAMRIWEFESRTLLRTVHDPEAWELDPAGLLIKALGRAGISSGGGAVGQTPVRTTVRVGRELVLLQDDESEISEGSVLGRFEETVHEWTFDSEGKQVFAILADRVVASMRIAR